MMFDIDLLANLLNVVDRGGFTAAAKATNSTQSTVSAKLSRLESQTGHSLVNRNRRGLISLTKSGEIIEQLARETIKAQKLAIQSLQCERVTGIVRLGLSDDIASGWRYPSLLSEFCRRQPGILLEVTVENGTNILDLFNKRELDHVLVKTGDELPDEAVELWSEPLVWVGKPRDEFDIRLITFTPPCRYREKAVAHLKRNDLSWKVVYVSPSLTGIKAAVRAGLGVTVLPACLVDSGLPTVLSPMLPAVGSTTFSLISKSEPMDEANILFRDLVMSVVPAAQKPSVGNPTTAQ